MIIANGTVFLGKEGFQKVDIYIEGDTIKAIKAISEKEAGHAKYASLEVVDATGMYVIPGLFDIHFHGCNGHDFCEGNEEAFRAIETYELSNGITSMTPATMTLSDSEISSICENAGNYAKNSDSLKGIYLEGPFLSREKKGAQNEKYLCLPSVELLKKWQKVSGNLIKTVVVAPEIDGAMEFIEKCSKNCHISIGHTMADYEQASEAIEKGARQATHLLNACRPFLAREPGVMGAFFDAKEGFVEVIGDGIHIHPAMLRAIFKLMPEKVILISDSMMAAGMPDGEYALGGQKVIVKGKEALLEDGTIAGSVTNLFDCMVNVIKNGVDAKKAILAASLHPAKSVGMDSSYGSITVGKKADLLLVSEDWELRQVIKHGRVVS